MTEAVRTAHAMIAGMMPALMPEPYRFCTTDDPARSDRAMPRAKGVFREAEGVSLILTARDAETFGFPAGPDFRCITLTIHSSLQGVGLTAAVATALAGEGIACNIVAAHHHDHVFVPAHQADEAMALLRSLQAKAMRTRDGG